MSDEGHETLLSALLSTPLNSSCQLLSYLNLPEGKGKGASSGILLPPLGSMYFIMHLTGETRENSVQNSDPFKAVSSSHVKQEQATEKTQEVYADTS